MLVSGAVIGNRWEELTFSKIDVPPRLALRASGNAPEPLEIGERRLQFVLQQTKKASQGIPYEAL